MASSTPMKIFFLFSFFIVLGSSFAARQLAVDATGSYPVMRFEYHKGPLLAGNFSVNLIWYGSFTAAQRAIVSDFITSLSPSAAKAQAHPSVSSWWATLSKYYRLAKPNSATAARPATINLGSQRLDAAYSAGKSLTVASFQSLASKTYATLNTISVILTSSDVAVEGFCATRCGTHGHIGTSATTGVPLIWVGNPGTQCPGLCAWPFHQPVYGPQGPPLVAPNGDVGMDGLVINLATLLAGTATNPFGGGFFQGPKEAPLEAASACPGVYGSGAYPGYAGDLLVEGASGASYNANGVNGRKYLLPGLFDPETQTCSTLV
ncbi:hypothetical protein Droror1_Dr00005013 [Drosera rotundifolia]